jgi:regulatory protein
MTIVSFKDGADNAAGVIKIGLSDETSLIVKNCYLNVNFETHSFETGRELSPQEEETLRFAADCFKAERMGMRLIARAEQTETRLSYKLLGRGCSAACVQTVMARFVELDLVNDGRYAERWLRSHLARMGGKVPGPRKLSAGLRNRGIGRSIIKEAFDNALDEEAEFDLLQRFLAKNRKQSLGRSYLRSFLKYEGFSSPAIDRYFDEKNS